jgi:hypothetical protein
MPDVSDMELLRDYDRQGLGNTFTALVCRETANQAGKCGFRKRAKP